MKKYTVFRSVTAAPAAAQSKVKSSGSLLKIGLDIHRKKFVVVTQYEHATPRPPQGFAPAQFVPWVEARLREGFQVHVVYEACGHRAMPVAARFRLGPCQLCACLLDGADDVVGLVEGDQAVNSGFGEQRNRKPV